MYFLRQIAIKYHMFTRKRIVLMILIALLIVVVPVLATAMRVNHESQTDEMQLLTLWQIDGFEGGRGSRAQYLVDKSIKMFDGHNTYLNVIPLSAAAAEENLKRGEIPDMISCSPTFNAHLQYINTADFICKTWCYGSYCILTLDENSAFDDVNAQNTVINAGKDNLSQVAAVMCGLGGAVYENPTNAYLQLINGKYKYLLGTQRDIFRLKTRGETFSVKQVTQFNDLYQNISIMTRESKRYETCKRFIEYIEINNSDIDRIGLFSESVNYTDEMSQLKGNQFENNLKNLCGDEFLNQIVNAAANNDANKIKNLLK